MSLEKFNQQIILGNDGGDGDENHDLTTTTTYPKTFYHSGRSGSFYATMYGTWCIARFESRHGTTTTTCAH